MYKLTVSY